MQGAFRALKTVVVALAATAFMLVGLVPMGSFAPSTPQATPMIEEAAALESGDHLFELDGLKSPQTYVADLRVLGWKSDRKDVAQVHITQARLIAAAVDGRTEEIDWSHRLVGRTVVASLADEALQEITQEADTTVELYAVPNGSTVTLVIGRVIEAEAQADLLTVSSLSANAASPGSEVTVYGTGFSAAERDSWVSVCGSRADVVAWSDSAITFEVPDTATKAGYVGVVVSGATSNGLFFTPYSAPRLDDITPRDGSVGTVVTFTGSGFGATQGAGWVSFAGALGQVVSWSDNQVRVLVPRGAGAGYAGVVAHGLSSNGVFFAPYGYPVVEEVSPNHAIIGECLTIEGHNFGATQGTVLIGGVSLPVTSWTTTSITADVPLGTVSGYVGITRDGSVVSNGVFVTVAPRVTGISEWWRSPGSSLAITGEGFGTEQGNRSVYIGGATASVDSWTENAIQVTIPDNAGSGYVGVGSEEACSNGIYLVIERRAKITEVSTSTVVPGAEIIVTGEDFGQAQAGHVAIAGSSVCEIMAWSDSSIVARVCEPVSSGYIGVIKQGVTSNGIWLQVAE